MPAQNVLADESVTHDATLAFLKAARPYEKSPSQRYAYGTAGFRTKATLMGPVAFRTGLLAAILSASHQGKHVGVMITASHNPVEDNGVKLVDPRGEMIVGEWEELAARLANEPDASLLALVQSTCRERGIELDAALSRVVLARDTRPSGAELATAIKAAVVALLGPELGVVIDLGLQTTPELHHAVLELNEMERPNPAQLSYIAHFSEAFETLLNGKRLSGQLVIDAANGIGALNAQRFMNRLQATTNFDPIIINTGQHASDILNEECGADFVKMQMREPRGIDACWKAAPDCRFASLDGDADRLVYFFFDPRGQFVLLDGDRIAVLYAFYLRRLLREAGLAETLRLGVVQTAYANGAATAFLRSQDIAVSWACTGVKNLHHEAAANYDIGVYFEANGHGTVLFGDRAQRTLAQGGDKCAKLRHVQMLINQCVGDALSDLLLVEAILAEESLSLAAWHALYTELPSRQLKATVADRAVFKTTDSDTRLASPAHIQSRIDELVSGCRRGRAFVRPSGTEDVVRVYAEAATREECDQLAEAIVVLLREE